MSVTIGELDLAAPGIIMSAILQNTPGVPPDSATVCVGDAIDVDEEDGFLRGHGTLMADDHLVATVCGSVERVNRLITVHPFKSRYFAELGDVVVGKVREIETRRWAIELGAQQRSSLQLSAVNLPGGIQRRRTVDDELNMRQIFQEGDVIAAEVQQINASDYSINLHMRSNKYRKLKKGQVVQVPSRLIKRQASHFIDLEDEGILLTIGCNGWIWIGIRNNRAEDKTSYMPGIDTAAEEEEADFTPEPQQWDMCARFYNAAKCLAQLSLPVYKASLVSVVHQSVSSDTPASQMLTLDFLTAVVSAEEARRNEGGAAGMEM